MFENDIEMLKKKAELVEEKVSDLSEQIKDNKNKRMTVKKLKEYRKNFEKSKTIVWLFPLGCVLGTILAGAFIGVTQIVPLSSVLPTLLGMSGTLFVICALYGGSLYLMEKHDYKKMATPENLELEKIIDDILANDVILQEKYNNMQVKLTNYQDLIEYLSEYNDKFSLLESIDSEDAMEVEKLFNEYLNEKVDYSKVHFSNELPEDFHYKKLSNVLKK